MNIVHLIGNVGQPPTIRRFQDGGTVANISLATSRRWTDQRTGEKREKTEWHSVKISNEKMVDVIEKYISKGDKLAVTGSVEYREFEKDGQKRWATDIVVGFGGQIELLGGRRDAPGDGAASPGGTADDPRTMRGAAPPIDDDIPF